MSKKIATVLIGTSLTEASDEVVQAGLKLARAARARIILAHAYSSHAPYGGAPDVSEVSLDKMLERKKQALRHQMAAQIGRLGVRFEELAGMILEPGPAYQMLIETASRKGADLLVVGATEAPRLSKLFGSTAERLVRTTVCPLLVVHRELRVPPSRVLLPTDLSSLSADAFRKGLEVVATLSRDLEPASPLPEVRALYVITEIDRRLFPPEEAPERIDRHATTELGRFLANHAADSALPVVPSTTNGNVEDEVLGQIREWEPDLVVLGTRGRKGLERLMAGSVAARLLRDSRANILVIPPAVARKPLELLGNVHRQPVLEMRAG